MSLHRILALALCLLLPTFASANVAPVPPNLAANAWLLIEVSSGQTLAAEKADRRLEPASLTKLMTAYLSFAALRDNTLKLTQALPVSEKAWRTGGSKMFVKVDTQVAVDDLLKGMIVQSGNDACVVLAEGIAGSEENFAQMMNREAKRLGMKNTHFRNSTGLPDPQHVTTARDLAILATALIRDFPAEYQKYYSLKEFRYANISQPNRNRLLWTDPTVDGVKTGHTNAAGYCLISSALREQRRLLAVVLGTSSDKARATESAKLLNWGYIAYDAVNLYPQGRPVGTPRVWKGSKNQVAAGFDQAFTIAVPKGLGDQLKAEYIAPARLMAPVKKGQIVGSLKLTLAGKPYGEYPVSAQADVPLAGAFGRAVDTVKLWFK